MRDTTKLAVLSVYAGATTTIIGGMAYLIGQFTKQYENDKKKKILAAMALNKFVEYSDEAVCQKVISEMEFDMVTSGLIFRRGKVQGS